ncbi:MAG: hypothetical protein ACK5OW_01630 [bacterium]|jgi:hypothetical protein
MEERSIEFKDIFEQLCQTFNEIKYNNGDISDVGNEIGFSLGKILPNLSEGEIRDFIYGIQHGISLSNNQH